MKLISVFVLISFLACFNVAAQMSKKEIRRAQWKGDMATSGIGLEFYRPEIMQNNGPAEQWRGVNMLFGVFQMGIAQGNISRPINIFPNDDFARASNFYIGASVPLPFMTLGKYRSYNNSFRMHPIVNVNFHRTRSYNNENVDVKIFALNTALGYRFRLPFTSVDLTLNAHNGSWKSDSYSDGELLGFSFYPMVTFRWDGLLDKFKPTFLKVNATSSSVTSSSSTSTTTRERINGADYRVTRTTTNYQVTSTPTTVMIQDIGKYRGVGPKFATSGVRSYAFKESTMLFGVQGMYRKGAIVLGGTLEAGRLGHGSELQERKNKGSAKDGDNFYRRLERSKTQGMGVYTAANLMADVGFDFSSLKYGLFGFDVDYNDATPFTTFTVGYSFGLNVILEQRFSNPATSDLYYDLLNTANQLQYQRDNTHFEDPRQATTGLMGGWFLSCDIGHASLRMQWYKYRRAPLANGLLFSVVWRFD